MKKLLFVLAFAFIGQQAFSQMYIVSIGQVGINGCSDYELTLSTISPTGTITKTCIPSGGNNSGANTYDPTNGLALINQELNSIMSQGYKLINTDYGNGSSPGLQNSQYIRAGANFYLAIPWTSSGLEELATTLKSFIISPNPANTFVDISLDYSLKGESEVVFISEAGYISHKQSIGNISKNEKYNIDISKIPAGKYLVTIVNGKTYTTPQKLIVL